MAVGGIPIAAPSGIELDEGHARQGGGREED
jgi:hypothetical protein